MGTKLIEVALPLDAINAASAREKSIRHGHPSTLHLWWARRPLAAARAVLFASIVDDPSSPDYRWPDGQDRPRSEAEIEAERQRLHDLISEMVKWESSNDERVLKRVRDEIMRATDGNPPPVLDPFAGGGSIPLEAQRLGLEAHASDLNPVAVLINKALIEIPPKFAGKPPVNPDYQRGTAKGGTWKGAAGLAADVRYYGKWMRDEAEKRIGHLYPKVKLPPEQGGGEATVIAWLWARTVTCPNPACGAQMPLVSSFWLSTKKGKEVWMEPQAVPGSDYVRFVIHYGKGQPQDDTINRRGGRCVTCGTSVQFPYIRTEGQAGRMGQQLMAIVAEGNRGRVYVEASEEQARVAELAEPTWRPDVSLPNNPRDFKTPNYGLRTFGDLFTDRQLVALTTLCDLVSEARERAYADAVVAGLPDDGIGITDGGTGATAYADGVVTYLALANGRMVDSLSTLSRWQSTGDKVAGTFSRQALPMVWDFAEVNPFSNSTRNFLDAVNWGTEVVELLGKGPTGEVVNRNAMVVSTDIGPLQVSTDPPYYDNVGYADLSDFFYVWLRRQLAEIYPALFRTLLVPKNEELVATPYRFKGGKREAEQFFEDGLLKVFARVRAIQHTSYPLTVYYAFKQTETNEDGNGASSTASTGWETMLEGLIKSGFSITGTWPMRTERTGRPIGLGTNALASSIVLVCRPREEQASTTTRADFLRQMRRELPAKLKTMQHASIAPVDLAQAAIGPGMAIFSRYSGVLEPDGKKMRVRTALQLINQVLDEVLAEQDSEHDRETGWAIAWFEQYGTGQGEYGTAETLATARNVSIAALAEAGIVRAGRGKVQLLGRDELPENWDPAKDRRLTDWEIVQHLIRALEKHGQEGAARLKQRIGDRAEIAKDLAYRLYTIAERKGWAQEALSYNGLVVAWPDITQIASKLTPAEVQAPLGLTD